MWTCLATVVAACAFDRDGSGGTLATCGNGMVDDGEECDGERLEGLTCLDFGFERGELRCDDSCKLDPSPCFTCGNGIREGREDCDGADLAGATCQSAIGYQSGELGCTPQCNFDATQCYTCGNGTIEVDEICDQYVPSQYDCESETGLTEGKLFCSPECELDTSQCHICGNGKREGPERCDGEDLGGIACEDRGFTGGTLGCTADCELDDSACSLFPADWYDPAWPYRRRIDIDDSFVDEDLEHFPMLVSLTDAAVAQQATSAVDFVFTQTDGQTRLAHEVESYDPSTGALLVWLEVPNVISTIPTKLYVYYGNPSAPLSPVAGEVWQNGYAAVWHLHDEAVDEGDNAQHDEAATGEHPGVQHGNTDMEGKIHRAQSFDGFDDFIEIVGPDEIGIGDADCTISAWIRTKSVEWPMLFNKSAATVAEPGDKLIGLAGGIARIEQTGVGVLEGTSLLNDNEWRHVAWTQKRNDVGLAETWTLYIDGVPEASAEFETLEDVAGHVLRVGEPVPGSSLTSFWEGEIDELRVSRVARSAAWISASYLNQYAPAGFVTLEDEEALP